LKNDWKLPGIHNDRIIVTPTVIIRSNQWRSFWKQVASFVGTLRETPKSETDTGTWRTQNERRYERDDGTQDLATRSVNLCRNIAKNGTVYRWTLAFASRKGRILLPLSKGGVLNANAATNAVR
jgi:hypothetical protein